MPTSHISNSVWYGRGASSSFSMYSPIRLRSRCFVICSRLTRSYLALPQSMFTLYPDCLPLPRCLLALYPDTLIVSRWPHYLFALDLDCLPASSISVLGIGISFLFQNRALIVYKTLEGLSWIENHLGILFFQDQMIISRHLFDFQTRYRFLNLNSIVTMLFLHLKKASKHDDGLGTSS